MAYGYGHERWRKLYLRESTEDRLFPVLLRGLRDYLIRHADDDGTLLAKTDQPTVDLARALGTHPAESELVEAHIATLLKDRYLSHRKGRLWITNLVRAQAQKSPGATRQDKWRKKRNAAAKGAQPRQEGDDTDMSPGDVSRDVTETSPKKREEEKREEETSPPSSDSPRPKRRDPFNRPEHDDRVLTVFAAWRMAHGAPNSKFRQPADVRAEILFEAVETHGVETCLRVLEVSKTDGKVTGRTDERGEEHRSVEYLFKPTTFDRLLRAAELAAKRAAPGPDPVARARSAQPDLSTYRSPEPRETP